MELMLLM